MNLAEYLTANQHLLKSFRNKYDHYIIKSTDLKNILSELSILEDFKYLDNLSISEIDINTTSTIQYCPKKYIGTLQLSEIHITEPLMIKGKPEHLRGLMLRGNFRAAEYEEIKFLDDTKFVYIG